MKTSSETTNGATKPARTGSLPAKSALTKKEPSKRLIDDDAIIAQVRAMMEADPKLRRQRAIKRLVDNGIDDPSSPVRRIEMKMKGEKERADDIFREAALATHMETYPALPFVDEEKGITAFAVVAPADCESLPKGVGAATGRVMLGLRSAPESMGGLTAFLLDEPPSTPAIPYLLERESDRVFLPECLRAFGLTPLEHDGTLALTQVPSPVVDALARNLVAAWLASGYPRDDDLETAIELETERVADVGQNAFESVPDSLRRTVAAYSRIGSGSGDALLRAVMNASTQKAETLADLAVFAHSALGMMSEVDAAKWARRPIECLRHHLSEWASPAIDLGRPLTVADADWLHAVFGRRGLAPIGLRVCENLLKWQACIDLSRICSDRDAAAIVALVSSVLEWDRYAGSRALTDDALRLLFARLDADGRPYGECLESLETVALEHPLKVRLSPDRADRSPQTALGVVVAAATAGAESLCKKIAAKAALPTFAALWRAERGDEPLPADGGAWTAKLEMQVRAMAGLHGAIDAVARNALPGYDWRSTDWDAFDIRALPFPEPLSDTALEAAWREIESMLPPSWRTAPRRMLEDQFRMLAREVPSETGVETTQGALETAGAWVRKTLVGAKEATGDKRRRGGLATG